MSNTSKQNMGPQEESTPEKKATKKYGSTRRHRVIRDQESFIVLLKGNGDIVSEGLTQDIVDNKIVLRSPRDNAVVAMMIRDDDGQKMLTGAPGTDVQQLYESGAYCTVAPSRDSILKVFEVKGAEEWEVSSSAQ